MSDHLEMKGENFSEMCEHLRTMSNLLYHHKDDIPVELYRSLAEKVQRCFTLMKEFIVVKDSPFKFNVNDFDANGSN